MLDAVNRHFRERERERERERNYILRNPQAATCDWGTFRPARGLQKKESFKPKSGVSQCTRNPGHYTSMIKKKPKKPIIKMVPPRHFQNGFIKMVATIIKTVLDPRYLFHGLLYSSITEVRNPGSDFWERVLGPFAIARLQSSVIPLWLLVFPDILSGCARARGVFFKKEKNRRNCSVIRQGTLFFNLARC